MTGARNLLLLIMVFLASPVLAFSFEGQVVKVKDGDSLVVLRDTVKRTSEVRLAGIDAPEYNQPWGRPSRAGLKRLVEGQTVRVEVVDKDRYGRLVGKVYVGKAYVNAAMTQSGNAWAFSRYLPDREIRAGHDAARAAGRGLWSLPPDQRIPPATWRDQHPRRD